MAEDGEAFHLSKLHGWAHPCALCGINIGEGDPDIEIEKQHPVGLLFRRVWHKQRHDQYLDQGEEI